MYLHAVIVASLPAKSARKVHKSYKAFFVPNHRHEPQNITLSSHIYEQGDSKSYVQVQFWS